MTDPRSIVLVAGPRRGKSFLAEEYRAEGYHVRCGDPRSKVKQPLDGVEYLPEDLPFAGDLGAAQWVAGEWFLPAPFLEERWVCEGHVMARALRRWAERYQRPTSMPCERIIVLSGDARSEYTAGQDAMHKAVMTVWWQIAPRFVPITEYRVFDAMSCSEMWADGEGNS